MPGLLPCAPTFFSLLSFFLCPQPTAMVFYATVTVLCAVCGRICHIPSSRYILKIGTKEIAVLCTRQPLRATIILIVVPERRANGRVRWWLGFLYDAPWFIAWCLHDFATAPSLLRGLLTDWGGNTILTIEKIIKPTLAGAASADVLSAAGRSRYMQPWQETDAVSSWSSNLPGIQPPRSNSAIGFSAVYV